MNDVFFAFFERTYGNLLAVIESSHLHDLSPPALTSFLLIVAAEMGDKSQLVCMTLAARHRPLPVALGAVLAFAVLNTLAVVFGFQIANWLHRISGAFFLLLAAFAAYQAFCSLYSTI